VGSVPNPTYDERRLLPDKPIRQIDRYTLSRNATCALNMLREYANDASFDARGFIV
jgi:hypothetical protein